MKHSISWRLAIALATIIGLAATGAPAQAQEPAPPSEDQAPPAEVENEDEVEDEAPPSEDGSQSPEEGSPEDGSPVAPGVAVLAAVPGDLVISEVMQNPAAVPDANGEWFEITNVSASDIDLNGWTIADAGSDSHVIAASVVVPAGGAAVLGNNTDTLTNGDVTVDYGYGSSWFLANGDDEIILLDPSLVEYDRIEYDGGPTWPDPTGATMQLEPTLTNTLDNDDGANWCQADTPYGDGDLGTPGAPNSSCDTGGGGPVVGDLVITEVMQNPAAVADGSGEWFEVQNLSASDIDLLGWTIRDDDSDTHTIASSVVVPAGGFAVLGNDGNPATNGGVTLDYVFSGITLANTADEIVLVDPSLVEYDRIEYDGGPIWPDPNGASMQLDPASTNITSNDDGANWCEGTAPYGDGDLGTPGAANTSCAGGGPVVGDLVITEVMQNPAAVLDGNGEWFEITNISTDDIDLDGWTIADADTDAHTIASTVVVPAGGFAVLGNDGNPATNGGVTVDYVFSGIALANGGDEIILLDPSLVEYDRIEYDGGPTWPDPTGATMQLEPTLTNTLDNDDGANWCQADTPYGDGDLGTPGAANTSCFAPPVTVRIHEVQGSGLTSPLEGQIVTISGIVVGDFQQIVTGEPTDEALDGFFVQEEDLETDADPATSEGIFVFAPGSIDVSVGDLVEVTGTVTEFPDFLNPPLPPEQRVTEMANVTDIAIVSSGNQLPTPAAPIVPTSITHQAVDWEAIEGMSVRFAQPLFVTGMFPLGSFGELQLSAIGPQDHPNQLAAPGSPAAVDNRLLNRLSRVILDDGEDENESFPSGIPTWNPNPTPYLGGPDNTLRSGDVVESLYGVVHYAFGEYEVQPINPVDPTDPDGGVTVTRSPRPTGPPAVGGTLQVAAFNVLNYFTTIDNGQPICGPVGFEQRCRGADTPAEFDVQSAKIADAIADLDADIVGLIELENNGDDDAIADLVAKVNLLSTRTYDYIRTGFIGTDVIAVGFIYDTTTVAPVGSHAILDDTVSPAFSDTENRPVLAQTFEELATGGTLTAAVSHLKSKGSACDDVANPGDPAFGVAPYGVGDDVDVGTNGDPFYTGNCNLTRTAAAQVLGGWLAADPTGTGAANTIILGDLNAYAQETPVTELEALGYTNLVEVYEGLAWAQTAHSYVFDGELGTLDYGMANAALLSQVTGAATWNINADEPFAIDYQDFNPPGQATLDEFKSSDHDPVLIGVNLTPPGPTCAGLPATIIGTESGDWLLGTPGPDVIVALGGNDVVFGLGGDDTICLGDGRDWGFGHDGADVILGERGRDVISLGRGDDRGDGGAGRDLVIGDRGDDEIDGGAGNDVLFGNRGDDRLDGGSGSDYGNGGPQADTCAAIEIPISCEIIAPPP